MDPHAHNLLGRDQRPDRLRRERLMRWLGWGALTLVALMVSMALVTAIPAAIALRTVAIEGQAGRADLFAAKDAAETLDFGTASARLASAAAHFTAALDATRRLGPAASLPWFQDELSAVRGMLEGGRQTAVGLKSAIDVGADLISVVRQGLPEQLAPDLSGDGRGIGELTAEERRAILQKLIEAPARLGMARAAIDDALAAFEGIPATPLTRGLIAAIEPYKARLRELQGYLSKDLSMLADIPAMIGYPEPKSYLFLLLNNTELRPSGGFIGTYGIVKVADGGIESFFTDDVYALDGPAEAYLKETPPEPLARYLRSPGWFMRDANWSPDFVVSAMNAERFYRLEGGKEEVDGVVGITPTLIARLLAVTGPITIEGSTFTADNLADELEYQVEKGFAENGIPFPQRKDIVGKLGDELMRRLTSLPVSRLPELAAIAHDAVREKHLMAWFHDPALQEIADRRDWSGRLEIASSSDQLAIIDANLASLKTDPKIERAIAYSLRPDGNSWIARAAITYKHVGRFDWRTTRYRTYTRFYAPIGSEFVRGEGMMLDDKLNDPRRRPGTIDQGVELGRAVFGGFISIEPGETRTLAVEWRVSPAVAALIRTGEYRLNVQKQPGTLGHRLTLDLDFGKNLVRAEPPEAREEWGDARYRASSVLDVDRDFTVGLAP